jgi:hypothetical protein
MHAQQDISKVECSSMYVHNNLIWLRIANFGLYESKCLLKEKEGFYQNSEP